jgi:Fe-S-cluster containining protein
MKNEKEKRSADLPTALPVVECAGCGVCCFHMGYPAFITPKQPLTEDQIDRLEEEAGKSFSTLRRAELLAGHPGESHWHQLPEDLKQQWLAHVAQYQRPDYGDTLDTFDGPCTWLDLETRQCKNHLYRPNVCRDFETGNPECLQWRDVYQEKIKPAKNS